MNLIDKTHAESLHDKLMKASVITAVAHTHPDGDAVGSVTAVCSFLKMLGKDAEIVLPEPIDGNIGFITDWKQVISGTMDPQKARNRILGSDLVICLDFNSFSRAGCLEEALRESKADKVLIDHHIGPDAKSFSLVFSRCEVSSACEMLFWILMEMPEIGHDPSRLPKEAAMALMAGMTTDTNNFGNSVFPSTLEMASMLLAAGVDRDAIVARINNMYRENRLRAMGWLLKDEMTITEDGVAYMIMTSDILEEYDIREGETEGFVNLPLAIEKVRMSIMLKADGDHYRVSVRSKKGTSANLCARNWFNGGGHENAAGGKLFVPKDVPSFDRKDAAEYIEKATRTFFRQ